MDIFTNIISHLKNSIKPSTQIEISESDYVQLNKENFKLIQPSDSNKQIVFIDGGNTEIIAAPNFSLHFVRIYYTIYQFNKRIKNSKVEFYSLSTSSRENSEIIFKTKLFNSTLDEGKLSFNSQDINLRTGKHRFSISKIGGFARRFAELQTATNIIESLNPGDCIVLDGDLEFSITNEDFYINQLLAKSEEKNIVIGAISKTSSLFTDSADSVNNALDNIAPVAPWYYTTNSNICFFKLNHDSKYIFKFQFNKLDTETLALLVQNSIDPVFLGYPYGLIEADMFARVSNNEKDYLLTKFMTQAGPDWDLINQHRKAADAHSILDSIS